MSKEKFSLEEFEKKYVARYADRKLDWDVLGFQAEVDPKYRRAQMRYIGRGATANADTNVIEAQHFTLSTMVLPPGSEGPLHNHDDVEEVFFLLEGNLTAVIQVDGETYEMPFNTRDCISFPPGIFRGVKNNTDKEARMLVMLGSPKPNLPTYPEGSELERVRLERKAEREAIIQKADSR